LQGFCGGPRLIRGEIGAKLRRTQTSL
jgi:hypothetical protein